MDPAPRRNLSPATGAGDRLDFRRRWEGSELMDDPHCDEARLLRTLDQFASINRLVSRYRHLLSRYVLDDMQRDPARPCHLVDLGAGGCDIPAWLLREAARRGLRLRVTALDSDPRTVRHARHRHAGLPGLTIHHADLSAMDAFGPVEYLFSNHVLHHLDTASLPTLLAAMHRTATRAWIASDLLRSRLSYLGIHLFGLLYPRSFVFEDGKRSIRRGFQPPDLAAALHAAGLSPHVAIRRLVPGRIVLLGGTAAHRGQSPDLGVTLSMQNNT